MAPVDNKIAKLRGMLAAVTSGSDRQPTRLPAAELELLSRLRPETAKRLARYSAIANAKDPAERRRLIHELPVKIVRSVSSSGDEDITSYLVNGTVRIRTTVARPSSVSGSGPSDVVEASVIDDCYSGGQPDTCAVAGDFDELISLVADWEAEYDSMAADLDNASYDCSQNYNCNSGLPTEATVPQSGPSTSDGDFENCWPTIAAGVFSLWQGTTQYFQSKAELTKFFVTGETVGVVGVATVGWATAAMWGGFAAAAGGVAVAVYCVIVAVRLPESEPVLRSDPFALVR